MLSALAGASLAAAEPAGSDLDGIGKRIWKNECNGSIDGLTSWNEGENFASLGIGHFIWYPKGVEGPFEESFPKLLAWYQKNGVRLPEWLIQAGDCPWPDKKSFERDHDGPRQRELRKLLAATLREQTLFIFHRLNEATPKFKKAAGSKASHVAKNIANLQLTIAGGFALIDYVNFKGEGLNPKERYNGQGWGLLQVLIAMPQTDPASAPAAFALAAKRVLTERVQNSPPERKEQRWLPGWLNRCGAYAQW